MYICQTSTRTESFRLPLNKDNPDSTVEKLYEKYE